MIVLAVHIETGEIHKDLQDTPEGAYRDGTRARRAAAALGGVPDDYFEYAFASKDRDIIFKAKYLTWDVNKGVIKATPYSQAEQAETKRKDDKDTIERELLEAQGDLTSATSLGFDVIDRQANVDSLKEQYEEVKDKPNGQ